MKINRSTKSILDFAPNFYSGMASVLTPGRRNKQIRDAVLSSGRYDGLQEDWRAVGDYMRCAISKFKSEQAWRRK